MRGRTMRFTTKRPGIYSSSSVTSSPSVFSAPPHSPLNLQVISAFENFGDGVLTRREREVVRMVLRGHSSNSIGRHFQIATGTVKIHRKNIYAKLGISSQSELFSHFISYLPGIVEPD